MCTYTTEKFAIAGAGKGLGGGASAGPGAAGPGAGPAGPGAGPAGPGAGPAGPGSGGPPPGWVRLSEAMVYFDHPVSAPSDHALAIDFLAPAAGPAARLAVELDANSAKALADAILSILEAAAPVAPEAAAALGR